MKYFTKEYKKALQNTGLVEGFDILEDENFDINFLYKQREREYVEREREIHDTPPMLQDDDFFSDIELALEDILIGDIDENGNEINFRHPESFEEWEKYKEASYKRQCEEYENRDPFDELEAKELFKLNFDIAVNDKWQMPAWVYKKVDARLIALYYLPSDIYKELETISNNNEETIRKIYQQAEEHIYHQDVPEYIHKLLDLHDAHLIKIEEKPDSIYLNLMYGIASSMEGYSRLEFVEGKFLENEVDNPVIDEEGFSKIYFVDQEIYNLGNYFEFHFLLDSYEKDLGEYLYLTIRAKDLVSNSNPPEETSH